MTQVRHFLVLMLLSFCSTIAMAQMPAAISISPANATAFDELTLTLTPAAGCTPEGKTSLVDAPVIKMHSGITIGTSAWSQAVPYDGAPGGGTSTQLTANGDGTYSITFNPSVYYGIAPGAVVTAINCVFNQGNWDGENKDTDPATGTCRDYTVPLTFTATSPSVKLNVDMNYQSSLGSFSAADGDFVTVQGDLNNGGAPMLDVDGDGIYTWTFPDLVEAQNYTYKFSINGNAATSEAAFRTIAPALGLNERTHWYNDQSPTSLKLYVDMSAQITDGSFVPASNTLDVAGAFNGWAGGTMLTDADNNGIYEADVTTGVTAGADIQYKYRINGNWDTSEFPNGGPNRKWSVAGGLNEIREAYNTISYIRIDMTPALNALLDSTGAVIVPAFDPNVDFIDCGGNFNYPQWSGSPRLTRLFADNPDLLTYELEVRTMAIGATGEFKARLNGSWDTNEFPGPQPNRQISPVAGVNVFCMTWGVVGEQDCSAEQFTTVANLTKAGIRLYPNPTNNFVRIEVPANVQNITVTNLLGQTVASVNSPGNVSTINTGNFANGLYVVSFTGKDGLIATTKLIKE